MTSVPVIRKSSADDKPKLISIKDGLAFRSGARPSARLNTLARPVDSHPHVGGRVVISRVRHAINDLGVVTHESVRDAMESSAVRLGLGSHERIPRGVELAEEVGRPEHNGSTTHD